MKCAVCNQEMRDATYIISYVAPDIPIRTISVHRACFREAVGGGSCAKVDSVIFRAGWSQPPLPLAL